MTANKIKNIFFLVLLTSGISLFGKKLIPPIIEVKQNISPVLDGQFNDQCWKNALVTDCFHILKQPGKITNMTRIYITADNEWLYIGFTCKHPAPNDMKADEKQNSTAIHEDESIEIFIDPGTDGKMYFQLKLNSANVGAEKFVFKGGNKKVTVIPWRSVVKITKVGWNAEIAIPLYYLASYGNLEKAKINFCRNFVKKEYDANAVYVNDKRQLSSWAPAASTFHDTGSFAQLKGLEKIKIAVPLVASLEKATVSHFRGSDKGMHYGIDLEIMNITCKAGKINLTVFDEPISGKTRQITRKVKLSGRDKEILNIQIPVDSPVQRKIRIVMKDADTGSFLQESTIADTSSLTLLSAFLNKTYYTTETHAYAITSLGLPEEELESMSLMAKKQNGDTLGKLSPPSRKAKLPVDLTKLPTGKHKITVALYNNGKVMCSQRLLLLKKPEKLGFEWKVDRENGTLWYDGKPFFPYGMWTTVVIYPDKKAKLEEFCKAYSKAGLNSLIYLTKFETPKDLQQQIQAVSKYNLKIIPNITAYATGQELKSLNKYFSGKMLKLLGNRYRSGFHADLCYMKSDMCHSFYDNVSRKGKNEIYAEFFNKNLPVLSNAVQLSKDDKTLLGYNSFDEPQLRIFDQFIQLKQLYEKVRSIDGYHPVFLLYSSYIPAGNNATDWCDFLGTDPYWIPGGSGIRGNINFVAKITYKTRQRALKTHRGTYTVLCSESWSGTRKRILLPQEQYCQTYLALIYGAKGIFYFNFPLKHELSWKAISELSGHIKRLTPALVTNDLPQQIKYEPGKFDPDKNIFPNVHVCLRTNPDGGYVLLAANTNNCPVNTTYKISCVKNKSKAVSIFGNKFFEIKNHSFSETLEPFGVRAYRLESNGKNVDITINVKTVPDTTREILDKAEIPRQGRRGKRNILPNPSFEVATVKDWPDYYRPLVSPWPYLVGNADSGWSQDVNNVLYGKKSLRLSGCGQGFGVIISPQIFKAEPYTFSIYLKAAEEGTKVRIGLRGYRYSKFEWISLSTKWKRYSITRNMPPGLHKYNSIIVQVKEPGTVWADAAQLEKGVVATEFQE